MEPRYITYTDLTKAMLDNSGIARYNEYSEWERYSRTDKEVKKCSEFAANNIKGESFCPSPLQVDDNRPLSTAFRKARPAS